jgi:hypothetical protein
MDGPERPKPGLIPGLQLQYEHLLSHSEPHNQQPYPNDVQHLAEHQPRHPHKLPVRHALNQHPNQRLLFSREPGQYHGRCD